MRKVKGEELRAEVGKKDGALCALLSTAAEAASCSILINNLDPV